MFFDVFSVCSNGLLMPRPPNNLPSEQRTRSRVPHPFRASNGPLLARLDVTMIKSQPSDFETEKCRLSLRLKELNQIQCTICNHIPVVWLQWYAVVWAPKSCTELGQICPVLEVKQLHQLLARHFGERRPGTAWGRSCGSSCFAMLSNCSVL